MNDTAMNGPPEGWLPLVEARERLVPRPDVARGVYVHVPYCSTRCGYCDFNTYTPSEIDVAASDYARIAIAEIERAGSLWRPGGVDTVFLGGGTPTLLADADIEAIIGAIDTAFTLRPDAEVTIEANPDSVTRDSLARLRAAGVTRVSFGVQSLAGHVLATLDRTHTPGRALAAIADAREAGFAHISADLIYATPGETHADLEASVRAVLDAGIDHLSAYSLIVEPGTRMARQVASGGMPAPDDDVAAERYAIIDALARDHGLEWYEVSNWARPGGQCRHNLGYWRGGDWWAIGPGAHGYLAGSPGVRWWNAKHPRAYADALAAGHPPVAGYETIDAAAGALESLMLRLRLREGIDRAAIPTGSEPALRRHVDAGLLSEATEAGVPRLRLTDSGRLLADAVVRDLAAGIEAG